MLPIHDDNPVHRPAFVTWAIIAACLVAYFLWQPSPFSEDVEDVRFNLANAAIPCEVIEGRPLTNGEVFATFGVGQANDEACNIDNGQTPPFDPDKNVWLSVVTSMFLHGSLLHIGGNLLFLWVFGNNVEDAFGHIGYALFYVAGGVVATLAHVALNLDSTVPMVGASGAIAAVMGAYLVLYPRARVYTAVFFILITVVPIRAWLVLGIWFVLQFFTDPNSGVAWAAHVGGFLFGVAAGLALRAAQGTSRPDQRRPPPSFGGYRPTTWNDPRYYR
ncbi:MAG TPA: rhomboid family intramembrane serine protease [Acidimicrobiales bacterium]